MPKIHVVKQGECLHSIAAQEGYFWDTIWKDGQNATLREKRKDPSVLFAGDAVSIPDKRAKTAPVSSGRVNRFQVKGIPVKLRLIVQFNEQPIANEAYTLDVRGSVHKGQTDAQGLLEEFIDPGADSGELTIRDLVFELEFGAMDPVEEDVGVQARLQNLGLYHGALDGDVGPLTKTAVAEFQATVGLETTGDLDPTTRERLLAHHREIGKANEKPSQEPVAESADTAPTDAETAVAGVGDPTAEDEEFPEFELEHVTDSSD
jgi:hypothetical protein